MLTVIAEALLNATRTCKEWDAPPHWRHGPEAEKRFASKWNKHAGFW